MEGLLNGPVMQRVPGAAAREQRVIQRWLVFMFFAIAGLLALGYLTTATFAM